MEKKKVATRSTSATGTKKLNQPKVPPGSKLSVANGQLLVSTAVSSFDEILGGGIPVGSVVLIEEDQNTKYAELLMKYYLAEGVVATNGICLVSGDDSPNALLESLPGLGNEPKQNEKVSSKEGDKMTIAWRYQNLPKVENATQNKNPTDNYCQLFDLTKKLPSTMMNSCDIKVLDILPLVSNEDSISPYQKSFEMIKETIESKYSTKNLPPQPNVLRIAIHSLASPLWAVGGDINSEIECLKFLHALRGLIRFSLSSCIITFPSYLYQHSFVRKVEHLVDAVISLESFAGSSKESNPAYQEYHGLFAVKKLVKLNTFASNKLDCSSLVFKLQRKKFTIERLHLPPELEQTTARSNQSTPSCSSSSGSSPLDF